MSMIDHAVMVRTVWLSWLAGANGARRGGGEELAEGVDLLGDADGVVVHVLEVGNNSGRRKGRSRRRRVLSTVALRRDHLPEEGQLVARDQDLLHVGRLVREEGGALELVRAVGEVLDHLEVVVHHQVEQDVGEAPGAGHLLGGPRRQRATTSVTSPTL